MKWSESPHSRGWRKSSHSTTACVEAATTPMYVFVRASNDKDVELVFTHAEWAAFIAGVKAGEFDLNTETEEG